jgi:hypothetical protein
MIKLVCARLHRGPPLLLPEFKLRHKSGTSRFKIVKRIIVTNTAVHYLVRKFSLFGDYVFRNFKQGGDTCFPVLKNSHLPNCIDTQVLSLVFFIMVCHVDALNVLCNFGVLSHQY